MKHLLFIMGYLVFFQSASSQTPGTSQQKTLQNYLAFVNQSVSYVNPMLPCFHRYYAAIERYKQKKKPLEYYKKYVCSNQLKPYYYQEARKGNHPTLNPLAKDLWQVLEELDKTAKEVEIYVRLEDYKNGDLKKSDQLLQQLTTLFQKFREKKERLEKEIQKIYVQAQSPRAGNPYHTAEKQMQEILEREAKLLKTWDYNLDDATHTGWIVKQLRQSVQETDVLLKEFTEAKVAHIKYPANSMYKQFKAGMEEMQRTKRKALDDYNFEAKQSDKHSNKVYKHLLNYYNGMLVANFNQYVYHANAAGQRMVARGKFSPTFKIKTRAKEAAIHLKAFRDLPSIGFEVLPQTKAIPTAAFGALNNYMDFINEGIRHNHTLILVLRKLSKRVNYLKENPEKLEKSSLFYYSNNYKLPHAAYQKILTETSAIPAPYQKSLTQQAEILMEILQEMDALNQEIFVYSEKKLHQKDQLHQAEEVLQRFAVLFEAMDQRKEQLYKDVRRIANSYPASSTNNWYASANVLLEQVDLNKEMLFTAKAYFKGDSSSLPSPQLLENIREKMRETIRTEYENMGDIQRLGRNNGRCPYTPYEDIPRYTQTFLTKGKELSSYTTKDTKKYHDFVYLHNRAIEKYNKFSTLATVPILKNIRQPELFFFTPPAAPANPPGEEVDKDFMRSMEGYALNHLVLLLDVSSSMGSEHKLPLLKKSLLFLLDIMRPEDKLSVVIYSGKAEVILKSISSQEKDKIHQAIDNLRSSGKTNSTQGIKLAYKIADKNYIRGGNNRIILSTDGEFEISDPIYQLVERYAQEAVHLSVFSFGDDEKRYENLVKLAEKGRGNYEHITSENANYKLVKEAKAKKLD